MIDADAHPPGIRGEIIDAVGHGATEFLGQEVVDPDFFWMTLGAIFTAIVAKIADKFLLPNGYGVVILGECSSFHNLSLAMLCWLTVSKWRHQDWRARDFAIGAVVGVTMILFNVARICLMAWNVDLYHYWHDGTGAAIYAIGASLTVLVMSLYGSKTARRPA
jgi:exosortase/archaeosortase family protein